MTCSKEPNKAPETNPKETEIYELPVKEFKITVIKIPTELKVKINTQQNEISETTYE